MAWSAMVRGPGHCAANYFEPRETSHEQGDTMTAPVSAKARGLDSHYKVRVAIPGAILHLASATEPRLIHDRGTLVDVQADWITDHDYGDTIGHIAWPAVAAITWRWTP